MKLPPTFPPLWACEWGEDKDFGVFAGFRWGSVAYRFRWIPPGRFMMGSPEGEEGRDNDENLHGVVLTRGFWLGETTCTQALWEAVMGENPSYFKGPERPVETVSWEDAVRFLTQLNEVAGGEEFRLPTEAEWEYACRARTIGPYYTGDKLPSSAAKSFPQTEGEESTEESGTTAPVKSYAPNQWGLYEMHGNVWEWCVDWYGEYPTDSVVNPVGPTLGEDRVVRGGCWGFGPRHARSASRSWAPPAGALVYRGFRLARGGR